MKWQDAARKFRSTLPQSVLMEATGGKFSKDTSDSELLRAILDRVPSLKAAAGIDESGLDEDIAAWADLRAKRAAQAGLDENVASAERNLKIGTRMAEGGSFPVNELLRRTGKIGPDETIADVASDVAGGGFKGAAAGTLAQVIVDPTSWVMPAKGAGMDMLRRAGIAGMGVQGAQVANVGREKGFTSPEFAGAVTGAAVGYGANRAIGAAVQAPGRIRAGRETAALQEHLRTMPDNPRLRIPLAPAVPRTAREQALADAEAYSRMRQDRLARNQREAGIREVFPPVTVPDQSLRPEIESQIATRRRLEAEAGRAVEELSLQDARRSAVESAFPPVAPVDPVRAEIEARIASERPGALAPVQLRPQDLVALQNAAEYSKMAAARRAALESKQFQSDKFPQLAEDVVMDLEDTFRGIPKLALNDPQMMAEIQAIAARSGRMPPGASVPKIPAQPDNIFKMVERTSAVPEVAPLAPPPVVESPAPVQTPDVAPTAPAHWTAQKPRAYDHGLLDLEADAIDQSIQALERDFEMAKRRQGADLFKLLKEAPIHIADFMGLSADKKLNQTDYRKALLEIPEQFRPMFRTTGKRVGLDRVLENVGQEGFFGPPKDAVDDNGAGGVENLRAAINRVIAGEKVYGQSDLDAGGLSEAQAAEARIQDIQAALGINKRAAIMKALKARNGNQLEEAFNDLVIKKDPWDIYSRMMDAQDADMPPTEGDDGDVGFHYESGMAKTDDVPTLVASLEEVLGRKPPVRVPKLPAELQDDEGLPGVGPKSRAGLQRILAKGLTPRGDRAEIAEIEALAKANGGFNTPEFKAALQARAQAKQGAPPAAPPGNDEAPRPNVPAPGAERVGGPPEIDLERPATGNEGAFGKVADFGRSLMRTYKSNLIRNGFRNASSAFERLAFMTDDSMKNVTELEARFKTLKGTQKDLEDVAYLRETGTIKAGSDAARVRHFDEIIGPELDRTMQKMTERDPFSAAPWEANYWPRTGSPDEIAPTFTPEQLKKPLNKESGRSRAVSLTKRRTASGEGQDAFSQPITDPEKFFNVLRARARTAGVLEGAATKERTPENYPKTWASILADTRSKFKTMGEDKILEYARDEFNDLQLPDLFEAALTDRPNDSWQALNERDALVTAANWAVRGRDPLPAASRAISDAGQAVPAVMQLGLSSALNVVGLNSLAPLGVQAAKAQGRGAIRQVASGVGQVAKGLAMTAKAGVEDVGSAAKRAFGLDSESSARREFGPSGQTWNLPRRAVVATDRWARKGLADVVEGLLPNLTHDNFKFTDRSLPLTHPKNVAIARREAAQVSQGAGTSLDRVLVNGNSSGPAVMQELALQYTSPGLRVMERALPQMVASGPAAVASLVGAAGLGEVARNSYGLLSGKGMNLPGFTTTTEDEDEAKRLAGTVMEGDTENLGEAAAMLSRTIVSQNRSPDPAMRAVQNLAIALPMGRELFYAMGFGESPIPGTGSMPALGAVETLYRAVQAARKTGDWRLILTLANAPGLGSEWLKIVTRDAAIAEGFEEGDPNALDRGIGQEPQNSGWPRKIQAVIDGEMTPLEALKDATVGGMTASEAEANMYRSNMNQKKQEREDRKKNR